MCTVTFIPQADNLIITSNRDESPDRQVHGLHTLQHENAEIYFPMDPLSQGSWIAATNYGRVVCLLNGAYEAFIPAPPYRMSRGQIVISAAAASTLHYFAQYFDLAGVAPFTLLMYEKNVFIELVWDGVERHIDTLPATQPRVWSSATLYPPDVRAWRKSLFDEWMELPGDKTREDILAFHQHKHGDDYNDFVMNRNDVVKTLSVTSIMLNATGGNLLHVDLDKHKTEEIHFDL